MNVYHGTSERCWKPLSNYGYIYVTAIRSHAEAHVMMREDEYGDKGLLVSLDTDSLSSSYELLPDNDCHELDGYKSWEESLNDKGSFIIKGDTSKLNFSRGEQHE